LLEETSFKGFPVVDDMECMRLYGYVRRKELRIALGKSKNLLSWPTPMHDIVIACMCVIFIFCICNQSLFMAAGTDQEENGCKFERTLI
jgi:hypothetical protein